MACWWRLGPIGAFIVESDGWLGTLDFNFFSTSTVDWGVVCTLADILACKEARVSLDRRFSFCILRT